MGTLIFSALVNDNKQWEPTPYSRICSTHFIGGQYSKYPQSPAYSPTLFPAIYKQSILPKESIDSFDRHIKRSIHNYSTYAVSNIHSNILHESDYLTESHSNDNSAESTSNSNNICKNVLLYIQCSSVIVSDTIVFSCEFINNSISTQANIVNIETLYFGLGLYFINL